MRLLENKKFWFTALGSCLASLLLASCGAPSMDGSTPLGKQAIFDAVDGALTSEDCNTAVTYIQDLYNSANTGNDVRMKMASAYACHAKINLFRLVGDIASNAGELAGPGFWATMSKFFPSTAGSDYVVEGAVLATDALQASLKPGSLVLPSYQVNASTYNPGSVFYADRLDDANLYLLFVSMSAIGSIQSRFGAPNSSTYKKTTALPWTTPALVDSDGCMYAASVLNFIDSLAAAQTTVTGSLKKTLANIQEKFEAALNNACDIGCQGTTVTGVPVLDPGGRWQPSGCSISGGCSKCPAQLRDRTKCQATTSDEVSCAAAGLINFINYSEVGWADST